MNDFDAGIGNHSPAAVRDQALNDASIRLRPSRLGACEEQRQRDQAPEDRACQAIAHLFPPEARKLPQASSSVRVMYMSYLLVCQSQ